MAEEAILRIVIVDESAKADVPPEYATERTPEDVAQGPISSSLNELSTAITVLVTDLRRVSASLRASELKANAVHSTSLVPLSAAATRAAAPALVPLSAAVAKAALPGPVQPLAPGYSSQIPRTLGYSPASSPEPKAPLALTYSPEPEPGPAPEPAPPAPKRGRPKKAKALAAPKPIPLAGPPIYRQLEELASEHRATFSKEEIADFSPAELNVYHEEQNERTEQIEEVLASAKFSKRQREIYDRLFIGGEQASDVAKDLGVDKSYITALHKKVSEKLGIPEAEDEVAADTKPIKAPKLSQHAKYAAEYDRFVAKRTGGAVEPEPASKSYGSILKQLDAEGREGQKRDQGEAGAKIDFNREAGPKGRNSAYEAKSALERLTDKWLSESQKKEPDKAVLAQLEAQMAAPHLAKGGIPSALGTPTPDFPPPPKHWTPAMMEMYSKDAMQMAYKSTTNSDTARAVADYVYKYSLAPKNVYKRVLGNIGDRSDDVDMEQALAAAKRATAIASDYKPQYPEARHFADGGSVSYDEMEKLHDDAEYGLNTEHGIFFHGTSTAAYEGIKKYGLVPDSGGGNDAWAVTQGREGIGANRDEDRKNSVYLTSGLSVAAMYARQAAEATGSDPVMLMVSLLEDMKGNVTYDERGNDLDYRHKGGIAPDFIRFVEENAGINHPGVLEGLNGIPHHADGGLTDPQGEVFVPDVTEMKVDDVLFPKEKRHWPTSHGTFEEGGEDWPAGSWNIPHNADGGRIDMSRGGQMPNTGVAASGADWHPAWLTDKEYVVNQHSAQRNKDALAAANANPDVRLEAVHRAGGGWIPGAARVASRIIDDLAGTPGTPGRQAPGGYGPPSPGTVGTPSVLNPAIASAISAIGGPWGQAALLVASEVVAKQKEFRDALVGSVTVLGRFATAVANPDANPAHVVAGFGEAMTVGGDKISKVVNSISPLSLLGIDVIPAIKIFTGMAGEAAKQLSGLMDAIQATSTRYGEYSAPIAIAQAMVEVQHTMGDLRRAQEHGPELARYLRAQGDMQQRIEDVKIRLLTKILPVVTSMAGFVENVMLGGERIADTVGSLLPLVQIVGILGRLANSAEDIARPDIDDPTALILSGDGPAVPDA